MSNAIKQSGAYLEIVSFHLAEQEFCIDIMAIREIRGWAPVTPMPQPPPCVKHRKKSASMRLSFRCWVCCLTT